MNDDLSRDKPLPVSLGIKVRDAMSALLSSRARLVLDRVEREFPLRLAGQPRRTETQGVAQNKTKQNNWPKMGTLTSEQNSLLSHYRFRSRFQPRVSLDNDRSSCSSR